MNVLIKSKPSASTVFNRPRLTSVPQGETLLEKDIGLLQGTTNTLKHFDVASVFDQFDGQIAQIPQPSYNLTVSAVGNIHEHI